MNPGKTMQCEPHPKEFDLNSMPVRKAGYTSFSVALENLDSTLGAVDSKKWKIDRLLELADKSILVVLKRK